MVSIWLCLHSACCPSSIVGAAQMSDYRQQQELQEYEEWLESLEKALADDNEQAMREVAAKLQGYVDGKVQL